MSENYKYTIAEIAYLNERAGKFYFSRDSLKFFRQTRGDFRVRNLKCGRVFVFAPRPFGISFAEFNPKTGAVDSRGSAVELFTGRDLRSFEDINDYLRAVENWERVKYQVYLIPGIEPAED